MLRALGGAENSVITPAGVILPILPAPSANQRLPSGPAVMPNGWLELVGMAYSVMTPVGVILPILFPLLSVNQRLPSAPVARDRGNAPLLGTEYRVNVTWNADERVTV